MLDYDKWRGYLRIDKHNLDQEIEQQAELYEAVGEEYTEAADRRDTLELQKNTIYSTVLLRLKTEDPKLTDVRNKAAAEIDEEYVKACKAHLEAKKAAAKWAHLRDSFASRADMLKELCKLHAQNYFQRSAVKSPSMERINYDRMRSNLEIKKAQA